MGSGGGLAEGSACCFQGCKGRKEVWGKDLTSTQRISLPPLKGTASPEQCLHIHVKRALPYFGGYGYCSEGQEEVREEDTVSGRTT